jgi:hypothetical protein
MRKTLGRENLQREIEELRAFERESRLACVPSRTSWVIVVEQPWVNSRWRSRKNQPVIQKKNRAASSTGGS